jgi:hypothetical protein
MSFISTVNFLIRCMSSSSFWSIKVWNRWWHCERSIDACNGSASKSSCSNISLHDYLYQLHSYDNFRCLRELIKDYAIVCMILGLLSTAFGQQIMSRLVKMTNRNSYIAFSIGVVVSLLAILMTLESVVRLKSDKEGK